MTGRAAAAALARLTGLPVAPADVRELAERGLVRVVAAGDWAFYELTGAAGMDEVSQVVAERLAWLAASVDRWDAAEALGLSQAAFQEAATRHGIRPGRFGRYCRADVAGLRTLAGDCDEAPLPGGTREERSR